MSLEEKQLAFLKPTDEAIRIEKILSNGLVYVYNYETEREYLVSLSEIEDSYPDEEDEKVGKKTLLEDQKQGKLSTSTITLSVTLPEETKAYTGLYEYNGNKYKVTVEKI